MPQLDKLLAVMIQKRAEALYLDEDQPCTLKLYGQDAPLTKALGATQVVALLREIAPPQAGLSLDQKSPVKFQYTNAEGVFLVRAMLQGDKWHCQLTVDDKGEFERRTGMFRAMDMDAPSVAEAVAATRVDAAALSDPGKAKVQIKFYKRSTGKLYKTYTMYTAAGSTKYRVRVKMAYIGKMYVRAFHPQDAQHLLSWSSIRYFTMRR